MSGRTFGGSGYLEPTRPSAQRRRHEARAPAGLSQCMADPKSDARAFVGNHATNETAFRLAPMPLGVQWWRASPGVLKAVESGCNDGQCAIGRVVRQSAQRDRVIGDLKR